MAVHWVRYGRPAAEALRDAITAAKDGDPLRPVTVVVPSNQVGVATRRLLASGALGPVCGAGIGLVGVTFLTTYRLAELLAAGRLAAAGRRPVSTPVIAAAVRDALRADPGVFRPVAGHPATEAALVATYRELRAASAGALDRLAATGPRAADVVRLHRVARARLAAAWSDEEDLMEAALAGSPALAGAVVVFLPQRLSRHGAAFLAGLPDVTVVAALTGDDAADAEVVESIVRLGVATPRPGWPAGAPITARGRTRFVTASDADEEVRVAVRAIVDAVRSGTALDRIAVLHSTAEPYARLLHEQLAGAGIPSNGRAVVPVAARVVGRVLLGLLGLPGVDWGRPELFAWLNTAPVLDGGRPVPTSSWERASRAAGVVGGRHDWDGRLQRFASSAPDSASLAASDLRRFALTLIDDLAAAGAVDRGWATHAEWARGWLRRLLGGEDRRAGWPPDERRASERVDLALDRLGALEAMEGPVSLEVFARTLALELDADLGRTGRFGEGVLVGSIGMGLGLDLDLVIIVGMAEGSLPSAVREDSLLPDDERAATLGELPLRRSRVARQHRELLAALAGADRHLLCIPRGDLRRSSERVPSRWALDLTAAVAGERLTSAELLAGDRQSVLHVASFDAGIRALDFPATPQEHRLRSLLAAADDAADAGLSRASAVVRARRSDRFTRFDGNVGRLGIPSPVAASTSASRLEAWAGCPFAYFLQHVLAVRVVDNPEEELQLAATTKGELVHAILERFLLGVLSRPADARPDADEPWSPSDRHRLLAIAAELFAEYEARGVTGRPIFWRRDRAGILRELTRFLAEDDRLRRELRTRPVATELAFGDGTALGPVRFPLGDGRTISFRGKADRIDFADDGTVHVLDYKTGGHRDYVKLSEDDPRKLQLPIYALAARLQQGRPEAPVVAEYWFISDKGGFRRLGYRVTDDVLDRFSQNLTTIVAGIEDGVFPAHPLASSTALYRCEYCDPDGLGVVDLRRQWDRKRGDLTLELYAELVEPFRGVKPDVDVEAAP